VAVTLSKTTGIVLTLAIGCHEFFEGIAFGLQTKIDFAAQLSVGIIIHKSCAAVALGSVFLRSGYSFCHALLFLAIFSVTAPVGIIIGLFISNSNAIVVVVFMSFSGGTFLYVACSEIIVHEFKKGNGLLKLLTVLLGGSVITLLWFLHAG